MSDTNSTYKPFQSAVGPPVAAASSNPKPRKQYLTSSTASAAGRGMKSKDAEERKKASQTMAAWRKKQKKVTK